MGGHSIFTSYFARPLVSSFSLGLGTQGWSDIDLSSSGFVFGEISARGIRWEHSQTPKPSKNCRFSYRRARRTTGEWAKRMVFHTFSNNGALRARQDSSAMMLLALPQEAIYQMTV